MIFQQILALGGPKYKYRGRRMLVLQDLWRKLNQWSDNLNIISVDDEVLAVIKEYADKQVNEGLLFCEPERKKITSFSETAFGIDGIILNIKLNYKSLMSGLNFDLKKQTMFELIERLEEIKKARCANSGGNGPELAPNTKEIKVNMQISDNDRIRKRSILETVPAQYRSEYINAMNAMDSLELDIGCSLNDICNLPELQEIEIHLKNLEEECSNEEFYEIKNATDETFNKKDLI